MSFPQATAWQAGTVFHGEASEGCHAVTHSAKAGRVKYVYILQSLDSEHFYVGITQDLRARLAKHNAGGVLHTSKFRPWRINTYIGFSDEARAVEFERYLKSPSGRAFAKKRL